MKVVVVSEYPMMGFALAALLKDDKTFEFILVESNPERILQALRQGPVDVVLMTLSVRNIGWVEFIPRLLRTQCDTKVVTIMANDKHTALLSSRSMRAGAFGCLTYDGSHADLSQALLRVHHGQRHISPEVAQFIAMNHFDVQSIEAKLSALTERELGVMLRIIEGERPTQISESMCLSPKTVNTYRYRVFKKLGVSSDVELTHYALKNGIIDFLVDTSFDTESS